MSDPFDRVIGGSAEADRIRRFGRRAAAVDAPVLLLGESGTGKGILARAIHEASPRARFPFVSVNCAAVPDSLFESEFFGHVRGAFTGAQYSHKGLFEQADGGTLFLDEIGELPIAAQAKLLTVVEDRQVRRVGGERVASINHRIIAATACDLRAAVQRRAFRRDLFHRLAVLSFELPPLRARAGDVHELALLFLQQHAARYDRGTCMFDGGSLELLVNHSWPGNIRELSNVIESAVVSATSQFVTLTCHATSSDLYAPPGIDDAASPSSLPDPRVGIEEALARAGGNKAQAARALGISRTTLWQKLRELDSQKGRS